MQNFVYTWHTNLGWLTKLMISLEEVVGGLANDIRSGESLAELFFLWDEGGGAIREFVVLLEYAPGLGLDLLCCLSYFITESVSVIDEALVTARTGIAS